MKKISLISVWINPDLVEEMKQSAIKQKNVEVEFICIDNREKRFSSAAAALNYGAKQATGEVFVFLHQDIEFLSDEVLEYIYDFAIENPDSVFGAAGVYNKNNPDEKSDCLSSMYGGPNKGVVGTITKPTKAFTLDECLIACHKKCFEKLSYDEVVCDGWHLYGADLCLQAQAFQNMTVYAGPLNLWHKSNGNADKSYLECQNRLGKKYKKYYKIINTTNGYVYTKGFKRFLQNLYRNVRYRNIIK